MFSRGEFSRSNSFTGAVEPSGLPAVVLVSSYTINPLAGSWNRRRPLCRTRFLPDATDSANVIWAGVDYLTRGRAAFCVRKTQ